MFNIDSFLIRICILILPGLVGYKTYKILKSSSKESKKIRNFEDFLFILLFSFISYLLVFFIKLTVFHIFNYEITNSMLYAILDNNLKLDFFEIYFSLIISIIIGIISAIISNHKLVFNFLQMLKITKHFGDEDIWTYLHNSKDTDWFAIRDYKCDLLYYGYISAFSDPGELRELIISEVDIYTNSTGEYLYSTDNIYICRNEHDLSIETINYKDIEKKLRSKDAKKSN